MLETCRFIDFTSSYASNANVRFEHIAPAISWHRWASVDSGGISAPC
jgi:hypothetical protein